MNDQCYAFSHSKLFNNSIHKGTRFVPAKLRFLWARPKLTGAVKAGLELVSLGVCEILGLHPERRRDFNTNMKSHI